MDDVLHAVDLDRRPVAPHDRAWARSRKPRYWAKWALFDDMKHDADVVELSLAKLDGDTWHEVTAPFRRGRSGQKRKSQPAK
jgi:hypothetical protein